VGSHDPLAIAGQRQRLKCQLALRGTIRSGFSADANTDPVWEFPEKALTTQWVLLPG
jgi:hypothetical protein